MPYIFKKNQNKKNTIVNIKILQNETVHGRYPSLHAVGKAKLNKTWVDLFHTFISYTENQGPIGDFFSKAACRLAALMFQKLCK